MSVNRRELIQMTDDEMHAFIEEQKSLQVSCIGADGWPHLTTLWFAVVDQKIVFETYTRSQKILNLRRNPNITLLLEDGIVYEKLRGVMIKGMARLESKPENVEKYKNGKDKLFGFFVGEAMKLSKGKANPKVLNELLKSKLNT